MPTRAPSSMRAHAGAQAIDPADDLVAGDDRQLGIWQLAVDDMEIRPADSTSFDPHADLTSLRRRVGKLLELQRASRSVKNHGAHRALRISARDAYARSLARF